MSRILSACLALLVLLSGAAQAQTPPAAPAGMTQDQFNALVDAISNSVTEKLKAEGAPTPAPAAPAPAASSSSKSKPKPPPPTVIRTPIPDGPGPFAVFFEKAGNVVRHVPVLGTHLAAIPSIFDRSAQGGMGTSSFLALLGLVVVVAVLAEWALRLLMTRFRHRLADGAVPEKGLRSLGNLGALAVLDGLGVLAVWLICNAAIGAWFTGPAGVPPTGQDRLAEAVLDGIFHWRLYVFLFLLVLRPALPQARLCEATDHDARGMYARIEAVMLIIILARIVGLILINTGTPQPAVAAYQVMGAVAYMAAFIWLVRASRAAATQWFTGLGKAAPLIGVLGRHWVPVGVGFFILLGLTQIYGAVSGRTHVTAAMLLTVVLVVGVLLFETFMQAFVRRLDSQLEGGTPASDRPKLPDVVARCIRVAVLIGVAVTLAESWVVQVFGLADEDQWDVITRSSRTAGFTLFLAYVVWELFKYATDPYMARKNKDAAAAIVDGDANAAPVSRISTMMPLLRGTAAVLIAVVAVMIALESFGINITPLIAGASVFGIAISFGSQTLVRDIVSGIFYLSDDAFRVGEYIDCGRAKGTVEGFTLRSIKLRHQNGQVHTIPFGQLGQITNFSRDWITTKFNLRFARDTDIEKLRKAAKKIGTDMLEIPAIKADILAPFKMQGVADIMENALLVRFKFTARPGNPAAIQREAVKRMFNTFPGLGIEFAKEGAAVIVHTNAASAADVAEVAAEAKQQPAPQPTPAPAATAAS